MGKTGRDAQDEGEIMPPETGDVDAARGADGARPRPLSGGRFLLTLVRARAEGQDAGGADGPPAHALHVADARSGNDLRNPD